MTVKRRPAPRKPEIDLRGPDGNVFCLIAHVLWLTEELGVDPEPVIEDMRSGTYEHAVETFEKHFGAYVDLIG